MRTEVRKIAVKTTRTKCGRFGEAPAFGIIGINTGAFSCEGTPSGSVKASDIEREGSRHDIEEFTEIKYLRVGDIE